MDAPLGRVAGTRVTAHRKGDDAPDESETSPPVWCQETTEKNRRGTAVFVRPEEELTNEILGRTGNRSTQIVVRDNERTNALQSDAVCPDWNARALICTSVPAGIVAASFT